MSGFATAELTSRESLETFIALTHHESSRGSCRSFGHCGIGFRLHQQRHWGPASVSCRDAMEGKKAENADEVGLETAQKMKTQLRTAPTPPKPTGKGMAEDLHTTLCCYATEREYSSWPLWHAAILPGCSRQQHIAGILIYDISATWVRKQ